MLFLSSQYPVSTDLSSHANYCRQLFSTKKAIKIAELATHFNQLLGKKILDI